MAWRVKLRPSVIKELNKLPKPAQERILIFLESLPTDPRSKGKAMKTGKNEPPMWRYRAGDYRIVCYLRDEDKTALVLRVGHRKDVYR